MTLYCAFRSGSDWLRVTPFGIRAGLNWIRTHYNNVPVYVTENGVSDRSGAIDDQFRVDFYRSYINEVLKGISKLMRLPFLLLMMSLGNFAGKGENAFSADCLNG